MARKVYILWDPGWGCSCFGEAKHIHGIYSTLKKAVTEAGKHLPKKERERFEKNPYHYCSGFDLEEVEVK